MSHSSSEISTSQENQKDNLALTKSKFAALLALQEVNGRIFGSLARGILLEVIPQEPQKNKMTDASYEHEKEQLIRKRERAKKILGAIVGDAAMAISDEKINELIERYNAAHLEKQERCIQYLIQGNTKLLQHELERLYKEFQEVKDPGERLIELPWRVDEIINALNSNFNPQNIEIHELILRYIREPLCRLALETPSLQQSTVLISATERAGIYFVPDLGQFVRNLPDTNEIEIANVKVPAGVNLKGIAIENLYGNEPKEEVDTQRLELFKKIADQKLVTLTHITWSNIKLLQIIQSRHFGLPGHPNRNFVEVFNFSDQPGEEITKYLFEDMKWQDSDAINNKIFKKLSSADIEANKYRNIGSSSSREIPRYLPSAYISNGSTEPIFVFDALKMKGIIFPERYFALTRTPLAHEGLKYISVTSHFRKVLLEWISTWTDEERRETFGDKDVEKLFVADANDIDS